MYPSTDLYLYKKDVQGVIKAKASQKSNGY
jgi:hypothetical protein